MLKSIVVLDITVDRNGNLARVAVRRSNGYTVLEQRAVSSVRRAAPFEAPSFTLRRQDGSVNVLETFLFRNDGRFQIRSLVAER
jgi:protein TonB